MEGGSDREAERQKEEKGSLSPEESILRGASLREEAS